MVIKQFDTSIHLLAWDWKQMFYTGNFLCYALVPVKFQVILTIIRLKIQFLRWVVVLTFGTHMALVVKVHAVHGATYRKTQSKSSMRVDLTP